MGRERVLVRRRALSAHAHLISQRQCPRILRGLLPGPAAQRVWARRDGLAERGGAGELFSLKAERASALFRSVSLTRLSHLALSFLARPRLGCGRPAAPVLTRGPPDGGRRGRGRGARGEFGVFCLFFFWARGAPRTGDFTPQPRAKRCVTNTGSAPVRRGEAWLSAARNKRPHAHSTSTPSPSILFSGPLLVPARPPARPDPTAAGVGGRAGGVSHLAPVRGAAGGAPAGGA